MPLGLFGLPALLLLLGAGPADEEVYTWTDADGAAHYTNDASTIPARYREKARTLDGKRISSVDASWQIARVFGQIGGPSGVRPKIGRMQ